MILRDFILNKQVPRFILGRRGFSISIFSFPVSVSKGRSNMILLGDTLGDPKMADNMNDVTNILKIGFLNNQVCMRLIYDRDKLIKLMVVKIKIMISCCNLNL